MYIQLNVCIQEMSDAEMTHPKMADWVSQTQEMSDKYMLLYTGYDRHVQNVSTQGIADTYTGKGGHLQVFWTQVNGGHVQVSLRQDMEDTLKFI